MSKTLAPHQQRVVDERIETSGRLERLVAFIGTDMFAGLDVAEKSRMRRQAAVMTELVEILGARVAAFDDGVEASP